MTKLTKAQLIEDIDQLHISVNEAIDALASIVKVDGTGQTVSYLKGKIQAYKNVEVALANILDNFGEYLE